MRRTVIWWVVGVLVLGIGGCTASPRGDTAPGGPQPAPQPLVALDAFAAAGIRATRVVPAAEPDRYFETRDDATSLLAAGTSLVAPSIDRHGDVYRVVRSADLGKTWQHVDLPGVTASTVRLVLAEAGPLVVASGGTDNDSAWVTGDGAVWRGGPVPTKPDGALLAEATRQPDGRVVVGTQGADEGRLVLTADAGASWQVVDCPSVFRPAGFPFRCEVPRGAGGNLWIRGDDVSLDAGQTWRPVTVVPQAGPVKNAVALPGGGWLGTAVTMPGPETVAERLVRSGDGLTWQPVADPPCDGAATVSTPRALGDRWLVAYTCVDAQDSPRRSHLCLVDRDGTRGRVLATIDRPGEWFGAPVAVGDTVVVPEVHGGGPGEGTLALLHLRVQI